MFLGGNDMAEVFQLGIPELRQQLHYDAEKAKLDASPELTQQWVDPQKWSKYTGPAGQKLYQSFTDDELLDIIRREAVVLGHVPSQREVFCVYRDYIRRRFGNWVKALGAAGLREPKQKRVNQVNS